MKREKKSREKLLNELVTQTKQIKIGSKSGCLTVIGTAECYDIENNKEIIEEYERKIESYENGTWQKSKLDRINVEFIKESVKEYHETETVLKIKCQCKCGNVVYMLAPYFYYKRHRYCDNLDAAEETVGGRAYYKELINSGEATTSEIKTYEIITGKLFYNQESFRFQQSKTCLLREEQWKNYLKKIPRKPNRFYDKELKYKVSDTLLLIGNGADKEHLFQCGHKYYYEVCRTYKCKCKLCGKEYEFEYEDFEIYNDEYGNRAMDGYYSIAHCDCHPISSFQWRTIEFFREYGIEYEAEVSFPDLIGAGHKYLLRYDFAVYENGRIKALIECQGEQHYRKSEEFGDFSFRLQQLNDEKKREYAKEKGIKLIEIPYKQNTYEKEKLFLLGELDMIDELAKEVRKQSVNKTKR